MTKFDLKSLALGFLLGSVGLTTAFAATTKKNVEIDYVTKNIEINGEKMEIPTDSQPFILDGKMFVPVRVLAEALGYAVNYNSMDEAVDIRVNGVPKYETISRFLMQATDYVGVDSPDKVVEVWSKGLEGRDAALQYCVMTKTTER